MKTLNIFLFLGLSFNFLALAGEEGTPVIQGEFTKIQKEFSANLATAKKSIRELTADRKKAEMTAQAQGKLELTGIEAFKKYDLLLAIRYANDKGEYQSAAEVSAKDLENMNKMFEMYLHATPLVGRCSVGHSRRMIDWGMKRLEELSKMHAEPTEANNPELEIISKQLFDAELKAKTVTDLAARLGVKLSDVASSDSSNDRSPASQIKR